MPQLIDRQQEKSRFMALFVGFSGCGKTVAEASFPKPCHFEDFDGRIGGAQVPWLDLKGISYDHYPPRKPGLISDINNHLEMYSNTARLGGMGTIQLPVTHVTDSLTSLTYAFICQAVPLTHTQNKGKKIGPINIAGPEDYNLEAQATYDYMSFLKSIPFQNVIVSGHYVDKYRKSDPENPFSESIVDGKKLSIRDKIGTNIPKDFDHIFEFERKINRYYVIFRGEIARTSFSWLPDGPQEWTGKNFYEFMLSFKPKTTVQETK